MSGGEPLSPERLKELERDGMDVGRPSALVRLLAAQLLASQESCRLLAEALEYMLDRPMISLLKPELAGNAWLAKARDVLWAYRSSEAGKEKAGTHGQGNP